MAHKKVCLGEQSYGYVDFIKKKKSFRCFEEMFDSL